jgi:hypothetical protein
VLLSKVSAKTLLAPVLNFSVQKVARKVVEFPVCGIRVTIGHSKMFFTKTGTVLTRRIGARPHNVLASKSFHTAWYLYLQRFKLCIFQHAIGARLFPSAATGS